MGRSGMGMGGHHFRHMSYEDIDSMPKPKITKEIITRIISFFKPYWKQLIIVFLALISMALLGLVPPMMTKRIIDIALPEKNFKLLVYTVLISFGATIASGLIGVGENYLNTWIARRITLDMRNKMFSHLQYMSVRFFSNEKPGEIITRMTSDIGGVEGVFTGTVVSFFRNVFVIIITLTALFSMNLQLTLIGIALLPLFVIPTRKVGRVRWKIALKSQEKASEMNQQIQESFGISGSMLVKLFTREKDEIKQFRKLNSEAMKLSMKENMAGRWFRMAIEVFYTLGPILIYLVGGYIFITKGPDVMTIGGIITFIALLNRLYFPAGQIFNLQVDVTRSMALFERIFQYFDMEHEITDAKNSIELNEIKGLLKFEDVDFYYNEGEPVLKKINFKVEPGSVTALVGHSGAGKTTIINLIPRLYDVTGGVISIDETDIQKFSVESLRKNIGFVTQDSYLFNGSILENLKYANVSVSTEDIYEACKAANIHDFIMSLPQRYETIVGNRGIKLSGGEKQRLSIARVILKNPGILLLDEATSSLDSISEQLIQSAIEPLLKGRTSVVIAHRLSTIMSADQILVLSKGEIAERGTHEELLARGGEYKILYDRQFRKKERRPVTFDNPTIIPAFGNIENNTDL